MHVLILTSIFQVSPMCQEHPGIANLAKKLAKLMTIEAEVAPHQSSSQTKLMVPIPGDLAPPRLQNHVWART